MNQSILPTAIDVAKAASRIRPYLRPTPLVHSEHRGGSLKLENLQATGAYKVRGALNALCVQIEQGDFRPVIAASAGNHAQGMAWAAGRLGLESYAVVPNNAPESKIEGTGRLGAKVIKHGESFEEALSHSRELAEQRGFRYLHPFDDPDVIAGQGTIALELLSFAPDTVLIPIGGGGLASGMGLVLQAHGVRVVGVQVERVDAMARTLSGRPMIPPPLTLADGLRVSTPGELTRQVCARVLDDVVLVTEEDVKRTIVDLARRDRILAEGAGAVAVAALDQVEGDRRVAIVSGGNIDMERFAGLFPPVLPLKTGFELSA